MFKFVHISDFHLNKQSLEDWKNFVKGAFIELLHREFPDNNPIIICTGDLLDKAGQEFSSIDAAFELFKGEVVDPILSEFAIPVSNFICIPGNHDIYRCADDEIVRNGLIATVVNGDANKINEYVSQLTYSNPAYSKRVAAYKLFEKSLYEGCDNVKTSFLGTTFRFKQDGNDICVSGFNTVWNCTGDDDKANGICISEYQYNQCKKELNGCNICIAAMHHPLDWLEKESDSVQRWIKDDYDILVDGHVHSSDTSITTKVYGSLFIDTAPAFENDIRSKNSNGAFANGVKVIEINDDKSLILLKELRYLHKERKYPDVEAQPLNYISYSSEEEKVVNKCIKHIKDKHYAEYDNSIIPHKASAIQSLKDAFVLPPIDRTSDEDNVKYTIGELLNNPANIVLHGCHESGKSTLLYRMIMEILDNHNIFQTIPAYIDFNSIGNKDIDTCLKSYLDCNSSELRTLLNGNFITLFLDNYNPNENTKAVSNRLNQFVKNYSIRVIATHNSELKGSVDITFANYNPIEFENYNIKAFNAENIRQLMVKWSPGTKFEETNAKLQRMVSNFNSYSLPCSAMSVSLYLWSTESSDRKPVNPALLLDIFMEIILEKMNPEYLYRDSFDYENKVMLLANIAKFCNDEVLKNAEFEFTYADYLKCITNYLKSVGFEKVEADRIGDYFIAQKIFVKQGNVIEFSHQCFYDFLLAKRMNKDTDFKEFVLSEENYYKYERTIDYFCGLNRSDQSLLNMILTRFDKFFEPLEEVLPYINKDMDDCFTYIRKGQSFTPMIGNVKLSAATEAKGRQEDVEERANKVFDEKISRIADNYTNPSIIYPELMIVMLAKALRNLDGVEDVALKTKAYSSLVQKSLAYTFVLKDSLARYANNNNGELPKAFSSIKDIPLFFRYMPYFIQCSLHEIMGSTKLFVPIKAKLSADKANKTISDIEHYFSLAMLWDSTGIENEAEFRKFIRKVGNNCVQDYLLNKIYYRFKNLVSVGSDEEEKCVSLLADLQVKNKKIRPLAKGRIMKEIKKDRESFFKPIKQ